MTVILGGKIDDLEAWLKEERLPEVTLFLA
jgi:hypothetical protein